ncbi:hypothetical protein GIB67_005719 [Kingdonia uniflora]|uniref:MULE transposase domain-containing protein n=1 Tax=Kingdonia uniflora TaxID=39325 RepID=A0A7J7KVG8_9MAGN|nr:hypothetical protein GIB67_005719 [Kingdonia uniflora]
MIELKNHIRAYAVVNKFNLEYVLSNEYKIVVRYKGHKCSWRIYATRLVGSALFRVSTYCSVHTCIRVKTDGGNSYKTTSNRWVASIIKQKLRKNPNYKPSRIIDDMQINRNIDVTYNLAWHAKEKAHAEVSSLYMSFVPPYKSFMRGSFEHAYQLLTSYIAEVRLVDQDFVFNIQTTSCKDKRFIRCFWCFDPPKKTYKLLRPVVVIDRSFLKERYRGTLLIAIAIDPNNHIFPLAFSITDSETTESWAYFLEMFGSNLYGYDTRFVVISDRNVRIINVVPKVFPFAIHTFCAIHISNNIKTTLESTMIAFRMAAEALTSIDFDKHMNVI